MRLPHVRFTVRHMMVLVVVAALVSALVIQSIRAARRDRELAGLGRLLDVYRRASDRMQWAERMYEKGYVSKAAVEGEKVSFKRALFELDRQHFKAGTVQRGRRPAQGGRPR
jgi:hypothetical protein